MSRETPNQALKSHETLAVDDNEASFYFPYQDYSIEIKKEIPDRDSQATSKSPVDLFSKKSVQKPVIKKEVINTDSSLSRSKSVQLNQELQQKISSALNQLTTYLKENLTRQDELIEAAKLQERTYTDGKVRHTKPISLFAAPYFRDVRGMVPPENEDTLAKLKRKDVTAYLQPPRPWSNTEKDRLLEGVAASALNHILRPLKAKRDHLKAKLKDANVLDFELEIIKKNVLEIERNIRKISDRPLEDILDEGKDHIDWLTISATNLQGSRTEEECEIMWKNYLSNRVNKEPFTKQEDQKLRFLAKRNKGRDWDKIAQKLNTNRTAIQCLERYQTHLNDDLTRRYWTPEEDQQLMKIINSVKIGKYIPWNKVCCYMEGRTRHQIINRYERTVSKEIKRTHFSTEEDAMLLGLVKKFGYQWNKMKEYLPGRPSYTIRERYVNTLDPSLKIGDWSVEEDERLIKLIKKYGFGRWSQIAREMPQRTDNMCLVRAQRLVQHTKRKYKSEPKKYDENGEPILFPAAKSKRCEVANNRLQTIRTNAYVTLVSALETIKSYIDDDIDMETLDLSGVSPKTLKILKDELLGNETACSGEEWTPHYMPPPILRALNFRGDKSSLELENYISSENEDENLHVEYKDETEEDFKPLPEDENYFLSQSDRTWLRNVLREKLSEEAFLNCSNVTIKRPPYALKAPANDQVSSYTSFLLKKFLCKQSSEDEDAECELSPRENVMKSEISEVIRYFIQPDLEENGPIVLCPNITTLSSMEVMEATRPRLRRTAGYIQQSKSYLQYLVGHTEEKPKCTKCKEKNPNADPEILEDLLKSMQSRLLIVDDKMQKAAETELGFPSEDCVCEKLEKSRRDFNLLQRRFLSIFLWPSLMSSIELNKEQENLIHKNAARSYKVDSGLAKKYQKVERQKIIRKTRVKRQYMKKEPKDPDDPSSKRRYKKIYPNTNIRRSKRSCAAKRKSFAFSETEEENEML